MKIKPSFIAIRAAKVADDKLPTSGEDEGSEDETGGERDMALESAVSDLAAAFGVAVKDKAKAVQAVRDIIECCSE